MKFPATFSARLSKQGNCSGIPGRSFCPSFPTRPRRINAGAPSAGMIFSAFSRKPSGPSADAQSGVLRFLQLVGTAPEPALFLFLICQDWLRNAWRHSGGSSVILRFSPARKKRPRPAFPLTGVINLAITYSHRAARPNYHRRLRA